MRNSFPPSNEIHYLSSTAPYLLQIPDNRSTPLVIQDVQLSHFTDSHQFKKKIRSAINRGRDIAPTIDIPFGYTSSFFTNMQTNNSTIFDEMERLSMQLDQMESWEIAQFVILTAVRVFSICSCSAIINFVLKHGPIRNKVNTLVVNLCVVISINFVYETIYKFFRWKSTILPEKILGTLDFIYYILFISLVTAQTMLPIFWFLFLTLKSIFEKFEWITLTGILPPYLIPPIFIVFLWYNDKSDRNQLYYYFILYYFSSLLITLLIFIHFIMLKLEERLNKNKLDYFLYLGISFSIFLFPEVLCFCFELYFFDERGPLYYKIYYIDFCVDLLKCMSPLILFTWLIISNKYFRKTAKKTFSKKNFKRVFRVKKNSSRNNNEKEEENMEIKMNLNEVYL